MNEKTHLFDLIKSEEAAVVNGGSITNSSSSNPMFTFSQENPTKEGKIKNADGHGKEVKVPLSGSQNSNTTTTTSGITLADLAIPSEWDITSI